MTDKTYESTAAFKELMAYVTDLDKAFLEGDRAVPDGPSVIEGYKWILTMLQVGADCYMWADTGRPKFVDIVGRYKKWGGDNSDAYYKFFPIDPKRTYKVSGKTGDAVYLGLAVYGGPDDGRYSERIVGSLNSTEMHIEEDGTFEIMVSPEPHEGNWIKLEDDAVCALTRDYMEDAVNGQAAQWSVEAIDPPKMPTITDADLAKRLRAVLNFIKEQEAYTPLPDFGEQNAFQEPFPVPEETYGWAAGDASYAMGSFKLADDEALIIEGRSPKCAFWNMCLWNEFLHTFNYDYDYARVTINKAQTRYNPDGSFTLVVSEQNPGHPNWIWTQGRKEGRLWGRWFLPEHTPEPLTTRVVKLSDVPEYGAR